MRDSKKIESNKIIQFVLQQGGDLVGITKTEELKECQPWRPPTGLIPKAKSVIVFALKHTDAALDSPTIRTSINDTLTIYNELNRIGYRLSRFLEKRGFQAVVVPPFLPIEMSAETRGLVGDFSLRHAAVSAGLGFIGRNKLLITSEFGPRVRLAAVITDAELNSINREIEKNCNDCRVCIENCPAKAISLGGTDINLCIKVVGAPAGLNAMIRFFTELVDQPKEEIKKMIRSPSVWNFHQALQFGVFYGCHACMGSCPLGKKGAK